MNKLQQAKVILNGIAADIPSLEELTPDSGDETIRKTSYLLTLDDIRALDDLARAPTLLVKPIDPGCGDLMTIGEFQEQVNLRNFTDYDGDGEWATETHVTNIKVWPSMYQDWPFPPKTEPPITHVMWYNK